MNAARFRDVTLRGGDARPISLDVPSGAVVTLEGTDAPDGILSVLAAMAPSASGLVELLGEDVSGFDAAQLARFRRGRIALVGAQAVACDPRRSLLENLAVAAGEERARAALLAWGWEPMARARVARLPPEVRTLVPFTQEAARGARLLVVPDPDAWVVSDASRAAAEDLLTHVAKGDASVVLGRSRAWADFARPLHPSQPQ